MAGSSSDGASTKATAPASLDLEAKAQALAKRLLIIDGHVDVPYRLVKGRDALGRITEDVSEATSAGDFDYPRAKRGGLDAPFMSIYVPSRYQQIGGAKKFADELIDLVEAMAQNHPDKFRVARSTADVERNFRDGVMSLPMGMENGAPIEGDVANLQHFYQRGVRYITLTHAKDNDISDSSYDKRRTHGGLSAFGKKVVAEMNRLGIMVDVSHITDDAFHQVLELSAVPVIASHSSLRHFTPGFSRNMSDAMVKKLGENGGVVMINFGSTFISEESNRASERYQSELEAYLHAHKLSEDNPDHEARINAFRDQYYAKHARPLATVSQVADHIDRVVQLAGIDHVGFGSDFDGVGPTLPEGLKDASGYPNLIRELLRRGYKDEAIGKLCSGNILRVWKAVEHYARSQVRHRPSP